MTLLERLAAGFLAVPGCQDMISAVIAKKVGFEVLYGSGYWLTASAYGLPDAGIASYTQMLDRMATLVKTTGLSVIADADTGFGGLLNVHHTVRGYEEAGVAAIQIEDPAVSQEMRAHAVQATDRGRRNGGQDSRRGRGAAERRFPDHRTHRCQGEPGAGRGATASKGLCGGGSGHIVCGGAGERERNAARVRRARPGR